MKIKLTLLALKLTSMLLIWGMLPAHHAAFTVLQTVQQNELSDAVQQWKLELAAQQGFEEWQDAEVSIGALGPGTHGWLVLVKQGSNVVGYMIVYAGEDGEYLLGEYGLGDAISLQLLAKHSSSLCYYGPFHTIIKLDTEEGVAYVEPFLQEQFPLTEKHIAMQNNKQYEEAEYLTSTSPALLTNTFTLDYFSPYDAMPWLIGDPEFTSLNKRLIDDYSIETSIELGSELRYTTESWNNTVFAAYAITGYHKWNELNLYVALQDENEALTRYIAYDSLYSQGYFFEPTLY